MLPKPRSARCSWRSRPRSNWIYRRCIGCASDWCPQRTGIINQIRAFMLERGIAVRQGIGFLRTELPTILATRTDALSPRLLRVIEDLAGDWRRLDPRIDGLSGEIEAVAPSRSGMFAPDDGAWHRADHFERHGGRDRHWRRILQPRSARGIRRDGGSVFPAHANTGDPNGPLRPVR